jgi:ubiquinone/menaquinone biosynthesis C-methylase UbiE
VVSERASHRSVDYDRRQWRVYAAARAPSPAMVALWSETFRRHAGDPAPTAILDLGSGSGSYTRLFAELFDARVVGVEPSARMRSVAADVHPHPRVTYVEGSAEQIPLPAGTFDLALLSYVIHHVRRRERCARELFRVLRPGGVVLVRTTLRESLSRMPFLEFFPAARVIDERRMPSSSEVVDMFVVNSFEHIVSEMIEQETTPSFRAYYERIKLRAISTLELISDAEFEEGVARMRSRADRETTPRPVVAPVDLLVFRRP